MYIAIEGIKGSGKSTLIDMARQKAPEFIKNLEFFPITAPLFTYPDRIIKEGIPNSVPIKDNQIEMLFIERAHVHQSRLRDRQGIIIGDRSIATACVTRWDNWSNPYLTINRIKEQYENIIGVDVIIWLKTNVNTAEERISKRIKKSIRGLDETPERLSRAADAYEELFSDGVYNEKIKKIQVIQIDNIYDIESTQNEILSIIKFYSKS